MTEISNINAYTVTEGDGHIHTIQTLIYIQEFSN